MSRSTITPIKSARRNYVIIKAKFTDTDVWVEGYIALTFPEAREFIASLTALVDAEEAREGKRNRRKEIVQ